MTEQRAGMVTRIVLVLLGVSSLEVGAWALAAPRSFYDDFPGGGRHWVSPDGPFNEHFVRDFGGLNLAVTFVVAVAAVTLAPTLVRTAAVAMLLFAAPHLTYHLFHLDVYDTADQVANAVTLSLAVLGPLVVLALAGRLQRQP